MNDIKCLDCGGAFNKLDYTKDVIRQIEELLKDLENGKEESPKLQQ